MITEDYVSFETAKLLKEKGFDIDNVCRQSYNVYTMEILPHCSKHGGQINAPTLQVVMKWLREVHNILIVVDYEWECDTTPFYFKIYRLDENGEPERVAVKGVSYDKDDNPTEHIVGYRDWERSKDDFKTQKDACEAAINYCLENLI